MGLREFVVRRIINSFILILGAITFNFFVFRMMPGNPVAILISGNLAANQAELAAALRAMWGLDQPLPIQFAQYIVNMFTFNFGFSFTEGFRPVIESIAARLPNTLLLMGTAAIVTIILGVVTGIAAASKRGGSFDMGMVVTALTFYSIPTFWLGMMFILLLGFYFPIFPMGGTVSVPIPEDPLAFAVSVGHHLVLPSMTLALVSYGGYMLVMRNTLIDVLTEDYIVTARAKGVDERTVLYKHALRNAILPLVTMIALTFGFLITGATLTETVFNWYGLGRLIFDSVMQQNYPVLQAIFYIMALTVIIANFIADILYGFLDPRVRYD
ncbi:MAG: ABC transporter permease [Candidatus Hermodarchaeota archaeon]|nr:ABC transporter permease [Candidatus Hermodarchaeota archaeon]